MNTAIQQSAVPPLTNWYEADWFHIDRYVKRLQQRIYRAEKDGKRRKVRDLQRLLTRSKAAMLLSIKRVTQLNKGKRTPGVDGFIALTPKERVWLYNKMAYMDIKLHKPKPAYRTYIKKKSGKMRPLGIPTIIDRVYQNVAKLALEPQWEYRFEGSSYGFRPKRSTHDAIENLFKKFSTGNASKPWVFEGDFKGCFDNLNHNYILRQVGSFSLNLLIASWLKAGFVDNNVFYHTESGSPQGGIISPLLANIALHGMEEALGIWNYFYDAKGYGTRHKQFGDVSMVRYADDFVILCKTKEAADSIYLRLIPYLEIRGLELAPDKTKITHISDGFDFLGFNIRQYPNGKVLIKPSKESILKAKAKISDIRRSLNGSNVSQLISKLNPVIRGFANYWRTVVAKEIFSKLDHHIIKNYMRFLKRLHPTKSGKWLNRQYFKPDRSGQSKDRWILTEPVLGNQLLRMSWVPIKRHILIKGNSSIFDASLKDYFNDRDVKTFNTNSVASRQKLARRQNYLCPLCGLSIADGFEELEAHHKHPKHWGGKDTYSNLQLVHRSCHADHHIIHPVSGKIPTTFDLLCDKSERRTSRLLVMEPI